MSELMAAAPTMTSLELLDHVNDARERYGESVVRRNVFHDRVRDELEGEHYKTFVVGNGNGTTSDAMELTRDQCMYVLMRESKAVRRAVTARLNSAPAPALPNFADPVAAARAWADAKEAEQKAVAQLEAAKPAVEFVARYVDASGSKGFREVCKLLRVNEREFSVFLEDEKIMYRLSGRMTPYASHIDAGRFEIKTSTTKDDRAYAFTQARFTPKGIQWIAGEWAKRQVRAGMH